MNTLRDGEQDSSKLQKKLHLIERHTLFKLMTNIPHKWEASLNINKNNLSRRENEQDFKPLCKLVTERRLNEHKMAPIHHTMEFPTFKLMQSINNLETNSDGTSLERTPVKKEKQPQV